MQEFQLSTPVVFIIFNRPDTTKRVFEAIRQAKPPQLLVIADGPRQDHPDDFDKCTATRSIINQVDWDCDILTKYSEINLGCKNNVAAGLNWAFDTVEKAIILEDDCLPHPTFFGFCEELLEKYQDDERIMTISGNNFQFGRRRTEESYYFSRYSHIWGWATWRRAWHYYDKEINIWPTIKENDWLNDILQDRKAVDYWGKIFDKVYRGDIDTWDYSWLFSSWSQRGLTILPNVNLISNIGFGTDATHTSKINRFANMKTQLISFPLRHPSFIIQNTIADQFTQLDHFDMTFFYKLKNFLKKWFRKFWRKTLIL